MARKKKEQIAEPEWSHMVEAEAVGSAPVSLTASPDADARLRLAKRFGIVSLDDLQADITLSRETGGLVIHVAGKIRAKITQHCIVTMEPVASEVVDIFDAWYADPAQAVSFARAKQERLALEGQGEIPLLDESEDPEPIVDGMIDLGELTAQYLSLAIDPYPRKAGVEPPSPEKTGTGDVYENPFAALKEWKEKQGKGE